MSTVAATGDRADRRRRSRATGKRAALMPYVMGGFPTLEDSLRIGAGVRAGGRGPDRARPAVTPIRSRTAR